MFFARVAADPQIPVQKQASIDFGAGKVPILVALEIQGLGSRFT